MPWILKDFGVTENRTKLIQTGYLGAKFHKLLHLLMKKVKKKLLSQLIVKYSLIGLYIMQCIILHF